MPEYKVVDGEGKTRLSGMRNLPHCLRMAHHMKEMNPDQEFFLIDAETGDVIEKGDLDGNLQIKTLNREEAAKHVPREASVTDSILKILNSAPGVKAQKWHGSVMSRNNPDIFGCANGKMFVIEVKRQGGVPTQAQLRELQLWGLAGAISCAMTEAKDAHELLEHLGVTLA
jgi:hypothetical protein